MKIRVFLDTNVFIYSFEFSQSNSAKIIELLNDNQIEAIISEQVLKEVTRYFEKYYSFELAKKFRRYLLNSCTIIMGTKVLKFMRTFKDKIKEKDLEQISVVRKFGIKYLISYDRDFEFFSEYFTPKEFLISIGVKPSIKDEF